MNNQIEKYTCRSCGYKEYVPCSQIVETPNVPAHYCDRPCTYFYRWSDRRSSSCDKHEELVIKNYEGDHEYDQTGLWKYKTEYGPQEKIR